MVLLKQRHHSIHQVDGTTSHDTCYPFNFEEELNIDGNTCELGFANGIHLKDGASLEQNCVPKYTFKASAKIGKRSSRSPVKVYFSDDRGKTYYNEGDPRIATRVENRDDFFTRRVQECTCTLKESISATIACGITHTRPLSPFEDEKLCDDYELVVNPSPGMPQGVSCTASSDGKSLLVTTDGSCSEDVQATCNYEIVPAASHKGSYKDGIFGSYKDGIFGSYKDGIFVAIIFGSYKDGIFGSYKDGIFAAITESKDRTGSSSIAIKMAAPTGTINLSLKTSTLAIIVGSGPGRY